MPARPIIPARLTALTYALVGDARTALDCWRQQGRRCKSTNAGTVVASGAGAIGVTLGGTASYRGRRQVRPMLGPERSEASHPSATSVESALRLIRRGLVVWIVAAFILGWLDLL